MQRNALLFLAPHWKAGLVRSFVRARDLAGFPFDLVAVDSNPHAPALQVADRAHLIPLFAQPGCREALLEIVSAEAARAVLPMNNKAVEFLDSHRSEFADSGLHLYLSPPETVEICHDKQILFERLKSGGVLTPAVYSPSGKAEFPLLAKKRRGEGGKDVFSIHNAEDLHYYRSRYPHHLIQQYIDGREFTVDVFIGKDGAPEVFVSRERLEVRGGEVGVSRIEMNPALIEAARKAAGVLRLKGPCCLQGLLDAAGRFWITDVNLRLGSGAEHAFAAGADIPHMILQELSGKVPSYDPSRIDDGSVMTRYLEYFILK